MPYLNGVVTAGFAEATRVAQTVIHRSAEAGVVAANGEREDQAHAERIPEAGEGARIDRREHQRRQGRNGHGRGRGEDAPPEDANSEDATSGSLVDVQA